MKFFACFFCVIMIFASSDFSYADGYDAYGDYLVARLYQAGYGDVSQDMFLISDDGCGMNQDDILNKWIVIGTGNKRNINEELTEEEKRNPYYRRLSRKERRKLKRMRRFNKSSK